MRVRGGSVSHAIWCGIEAGASFALVFHMKFWGGTQACAPWALVFHMQFWSGTQAGASWALVFHMNFGVEHRLALHGR